MAMSFTGTSGASWDDPDQLTVDRLRRKIQLYSKMGRYCSAEFWMDKIANLSSYQNPSDLLDMCECLFMDGQYEACRRIIERKLLHKTRPDFRHLLGRCYFLSGDLDEALKVTSISGDTYPDNCQQSLSRSGAGVENLSNNSSKFAAMDEDQEETREYLAAIQVLRGRIFDKLENPQNACQAYQLALELDPYSYDALEQLAIRKALSEGEQEQLLRRAADDSGDDSMIEVVYKNQLGLDDLDDVELDWSDSKFRHNPDFQLTKADRFLSRRDFTSCLDVTQKIFDAKPYYRRALPVHIAALVQLGKSSQLFDLSHRLVALYPQEILPWYATASYYFVCGHMELTRRHLAKALGIDKSCGYVWLLYGHSFSREKEHDQAMAAYFHAANVMKGSHFPSLYIAREYVRTNNFVLAEKFYDEARKLAQADPVVLHELGVLSLKKSESNRGSAATLDTRKDLITASEYLTDALGLLKMDTRRQRLMDVAVEGIYESLAATHLKLREPKETLRYAQLAFQLNASNASALKLTGMAYVMLDQLPAAVDAFQHSLALGKDDQQTKKMLGEIVESCVSEGPGSVIPMLDLTAKRRIRTAKAPNELPRTPSKRSLRKELSVPDISVVATASPMDMSIDASFLGEFAIRSTSEMSANL